MNLLIHTTKGLETITQAELTQANIPITKTATKLIYASYTSDLNTLSTLRTVDDVGIFLGEFKITTHTTEVDIANQIADFDFSEALAAIQQVRTISDNFAVTLGKYRVNIDPELLKSQLAQLFSVKLQMQFTERNHENFDVRVGIEPGKVTLSVRLFQKPLHERAYVAQPYLGSLKPTICAAMYQIAFDKHARHTGLHENEHKNVSIVDNFCGSGTILCEAYLQGAIVAGGDINPDAVEIAKSRLAALGVEKPDINVCSAYATKWDDHQFDIGISNPPWDEQLKVDSATELYAGSIAEYRRILKDDCVICMITKMPELVIKELKLNFPKHRVESRVVSFNGQLPTVVVGYR